MKVRRAEVKGGSREAGRRYEVREGRGEREREKEKGRRGRRGGKGARVREREGVMAELAGERGRRKEVGMWEGLGGRRKEGGREGEGWRYVCVARRESSIVVALVLSVWG